MKSLPVCLSIPSLAALALTGCFTEVAVDESQLASWDRDAIAELVRTARSPAGNLAYDADGDGVPSFRDCNDHDPTYGARLYIDGFDTDSGWLTSPQPLSSSPWLHRYSAIHATDGGQQAVLGEPRAWRDLVAVAVVSSKGSTGCCGSDDPTHRWRAGILLRAVLDHDQDEGFHGYRCGLGSNAAGTGGSPQSGPSTGRFLQLAEFMDAPEDEHCSECSGGVNNTFDELARSSHGGGDLASGETAVLFFSAVGDRLSCSVTSTAGQLTAQAHDDSFTSGTVGLSTLNLYGQFQSLVVCEVLTP